MMSSDRNVSASRIEFFTRSLVFLSVCHGALGCVDEPADTGAESDNATSPADTSNVTFGINSDYFHHFVADVPGSHGYRGYARKPTKMFPKGYVPKTWETPPGVTNVFTLYLRPGPLIDGEFDTELLSFFDTAPPNSYVTLWQEVGTLDFHTWNVFPDNIAAMNHHMQKLIDDNRGGRRMNQAKNIKFGPVVIGIGAINQVGDAEYRRLKALMEDGPYDFYGVDVYDGDRPFLRDSTGAISRAKIDEKMGFFRMIAQELSGRANPEIIITEVNSPKHDNRAALFTYLGEWMNGHHGTVMLTHYNKCGPDSGPWDECDAKHPNACATIKALDSLQHRFGTVATVESGSDPVLQPCAPAETMQE
jgi:hypothetical protein